MLHELVLRRVFQCWSRSAVTTGATSTIKKGELVLDIYDPQSHELVWCGVARKALDSKANPDKQQKHLEKAVAKLIGNYPPPKR